MPMPRIDIPSVHDADHEAPPMNHTAMMSSLKDWAAFGVAMLSRAKKISPATRHHAHIDEDEER